ncbi:MAG: deoxyribonuclease IV [Aquificae bacterium]|nr:deoxyribonuclease IV [Aquificota bacterium]
MARIGLHLSSAGPLTALTGRARELGLECFQFFLGSPRVWKPKSPSAEERALFARSLKGFKVALHAPYLVNPATGKPELRRRSFERLLLELEFCEETGVDYLVVHPGRARDEKEGLKRAAAFFKALLNAVKPVKTLLLLENTAGARGDLGKSVEELAYLLEQLEAGLCVDTCHAFAYGYDLSSEEGLKQFKEALKRYGLLGRVRLVHANDSKTPLGSKRDRHEHVGRGYLGLKAFSLLLKDEPFGSLPFILETPKEDRMDEVNLNLLRKLREERP